MYLQRVIQDAFDGKDYSLALRYIHANWGDNPGCANEYAVKIINAIIERLSGGKITPMAERFFTEILRCVRCGQRYFNDQYMVEWLPHSFHLHNVYPELPISTRGVCPKRVCRVIRCRLCPRAQRNITKQLTILQWGVCTRHDDVRSLDSILPPTPRQVIQVVKRNLGLNSPREKG